MDKSNEEFNAGNWKQCFAIATGLATLLATQVATVWALNVMLLG